MYRKVLRVASLVSLFVVQTAGPVLALSPETSKSNSFGDPTLTARPLYVNSLVSRHVSLFAKGDAIELYVDALTEDNINTATGTIGSVPGSQYSSLLSQSFTSGSPLGLGFSLSGISGGSSAGSGSTGGNRPGGGTGGSGGGPVAPEPLSMALVASGLAGLPLARRVRKSLGSKR